MATAWDAKKRVWLSVGSGLLIILLIIGLQLAGQRERTAEAALGQQRLEVVQHMQLAFATALQAERAAVLAVTDATSRQHADEVRVAARQVAADIDHYAALAAQDPDAAEQERLTQLKRAFAVWQRTDGQILDFAGQNSNLKAYKLAFGPAAEAVAAADLALAHAALARDAALQPAAEARIALWRILALLAPHIAEESDAKMAAMEAAMQAEDAVVARSLAALAALPGDALTADLQAARSSYARFAELRQQILKLSRDNTNVHALALSLNEGLTAAGACERALDALRRVLVLQQAPGSQAKPR